MEEKFCRGLSFLLTLKRWSKIGTLCYGHEKAQNPCYSSKVKGLLAVPQRDAFTRSGAIDFAGGGKKLLFSINYGT